MQKLYGFAVLLIDRLKLVVYIVKMNMIRCARLCKILEYYIQLVVAIRFGYFSDDCSRWRSIVTAGMPFFKNPLNGHAGRSSDVRSDSV